MTGGTLDARDPSPVGKGQALTCEQALDTIRALMLGVQHEDTIEARVARLMERVASHAHAELLRDALTEHGARALLDTGGQAITSRGHA